MGLVNPSPHLPSTWPFDVLQVGNQDLRNEPLRTRRKVLCAGTRMALGGYLVAAEYALSSSVRLRATHFLERILRLADQQGRGVRRTCAARAALRCGDRPAEEAARDSRKGSVARHRRQNPIARHGRLSPGTLRRAMTAEPFAFATSVRLHYIGRDQRAPPRQSWRRCPAAFMPPGRIECLNGGGEAKLSSPHTEPQNSRESDVEDPPNTTAPARTPHDR
jgi:hypothetical protein